MFLVSDTQVTRHARIGAFAGKDAAIGAILAAVDFEWTIRRVIIGCGYHTNKHIRDRILSRCHGLEQYKTAWKSEVIHQFPNAPLLPALVPNWDFVVSQAFPLRHRLVHGIVGTTGEPFAKKRTKALIAASVALALFAAEKGVDVYSRLPIRRVRRQL